MMWRLTGKVKALIDVVERRRQRETLLRFGQILHNVTDIAVITGAVGHGSCS